MTTKQMDATDATIALQQRATNVGKRTTDGAWVSYYLDGMDKVVADAIHADKVGTMESILETPSPATHYVFVPWGMSITDAIALAVGPAAKPKREAPPAS